VRNQGSGFTQEERDVLFQKFSRLKNENTRGQRGSGLGLYLCLQIAESHGGRVWAESEPGQWAEFRICIPAHATVDQSLEQMT
jgi:signal transduction histidine kinase